MAGEGPLRILHVLGGMNRGGVETWLMHVLRHIDRERFHMDFLVHTDQPCAYDDEIRSLGAEIIPCLSQPRPLTYARNFKRILRERVPYDVIHSHVHHFSGYVLRLAHQEGIPTRIAHSHSDTSALQASARFLRGIYLRLTEKWIAQHSTIGLAASRKAAVALFGPGWEAETHRRILYYGIDLVPFRVPTSRTAVRGELNIPPDAFVIGHVGSFIEVKNHSFLVDVVSEIVKDESKAHLLLIGDGKLRSTIEQRVKRAGTADRVIFAGIRSDVPRLMLGAMDAFLLPSLYEGLPMVGIEAQAAGIPVIVSDAVTPEIDIIPGLVRRLSLAQSPAVWAEVTMAALAGAANSVKLDTLALLEQSHFDIRRMVKELEKCYSPIDLTQVQD